MTTTLAPPDYQSYLDLTASFANSAEKTPFGYYDNVPEFQTDANGFVKFVSRKLGGSVLEVELTNPDVYACLEEAVLAYSEMVNSYQAKSVLVDLIGTPTGSLSGSENKNPAYNLNLAVKRAEAYGSEALVGGHRPLFSGSITMVPGQQNYDLQSLMSASGQFTGSNKIQVREMFHFSRVAAYRFFDTSSAINYLNNEFRFESFTPETVFYLLPIWEDILRAQQIKMSDRIRTSQYAYNIVNNQLRLYPVPSTTTRLHFTYYLDGASPYDFNDPSTYGVSNLSNVPFGNIPYSGINSIGKSWIRRYALALCKDVLGQVRGKLNEIPIPNGSMILNGADLIAQSREEQAALREELKMLLDSLTYQNLLEQSANDADAIRRQLSNVPMLPFVG